MRYRIPMWPTTPSERIIYGMTFCGLVIRGKAFHSLLGTPKEFTERSDWITPVTLSVADWLGTSVADSAVWRRAATGEGA